MSDYKEKMAYGEWEILDESTIIDLKNAFSQYENLGIMHRTQMRLKCSNCNVQTFVDKNIYYSFCPHCGARMSYLFDPNDKEIIREAMCDDYCKWAEKWDDEKEGCELAESEHCKKCPLNRLPERR